MKRTVLTIIWMNMALMSFAQTEDEFAKFVNSRQQEYKEYIDKQNQEFINFLKEYWTEYQTEKPVKRPRKPEPLKPILFDKAKQPAMPSQITVGGVVTMPPPLINPVKVGKPEKVLNIKIPKPELMPDQAPKVSVAPPRNPLPQESEPMPGQNAKEWVIVDYYGSTIYIDNALKECLSLKGITEKDIAQGWEALCKKNYRLLISDCKNTKDYFHMCDWGYVLFTGKVAEALCGSSTSSEKILMQLFILSQSGYKAKVARKDDKLVLLIATDGVLYGIPYYTLQEERYFLLYDNSLSDKIFTYEKNFAKANKKVCMRIMDQQVMRQILKKRLVQARAYPVATETRINKALIDFYRDYPQCEFYVYAGAPVSDEIEETVLPALENAVKGKDKVEAANILLNFVQTAFQYQTDQQQFGYEKPFFIDEIFYYPYSDCEDRAILYQFLVRRLLKLEAVLLDYPEHLATAVHFPRNVKGDFVMVGDKKYIVCDPTFINASIGCAMPQYKGAKVKVIKAE